jgi:hypothetical protein
MVDADAITATRFILEAFHVAQVKRPNVVVELLKHTNVKFLSLIGRHGTAANMPRASKGLKKQRANRSRIEYALKARHREDDASEDEANALLPFLPSSREADHLLEPAYASGRYTYR